MKPPSDPDDWEARALLPARLLAGADPETREKLQKAGKYLYLLILEGLGSEPTGSTLAYEFQTLLGELRILQRHLQAAGDLESITVELDSVLADAEGHLRALKMAPVAEDSGLGDDPGLRPFILSLSCHPAYQTAIRTLGEGASALRGKPDRTQWLSALLMDLRWVRTVLRHHIAARAEISCLRPGECCLCSMASLLSRSLRRAEEQLEQVVEALQAGAA